MIRAAFAVIIVLALASPSTADRITSDPNTPAARASATPTAKADTRLARKLTYKVKLKPIAAILQDWSDQTGVKFIAGKSASDWVVREDVATVCAEDVSLARLMDSLACVMKFAWIKAGTEPEWSYRLIEDPKAIKDIRDREARHLREKMEKRKKLHDLFMKLDSPTEAQLALLKEQNPCLYLLAKTGDSRPIADFLRKAPEVTQAWLQGRSLTLPVRDLPKSVHDALLAAWHASLHQVLMMDRVPDAGMQKSYREFDARVADCAIQVDAGGPTSTYGGIHCDWFPLPLDQPEGVMLLYNKAQVRAYEENRPVRAVLDEMRPELAKAREARRRESPPYNDTMEYLLPIADEPYVHDKLKAKIDSNAISGMVFQLAEATGCTVVTDDFRGRTAFKADRKREIGETIDEIARSWRMNWQRKGDTIEVWNRDWYEVRLSRVSKTWLEGLRKRCKDNCTIDVDDLADIAALTDNQYIRHMLRDPVLRHVCHAARVNRDQLKLYGSLARDQRAMLFSEVGLGFESLNESQIASAMKLAGGLDISAFEGADIKTLGLRLTAARGMDGKAITYTMRILSLLGPLPGSYTFKTPVYTPPPPPAASKSQPAATSSQNSE